MVPQPTALRNSGQHTNTFLSTSFVDQWGNLCSHGVFHVKPAQKKKLQRVAFSDTSAIMICCLLLLLHFWKPGKPELITWKEGNVVYYQQSIGVILQDLEKKYGVSIEVRNKNLMRAEVTTSFRQGLGVEETLKSLCKLTHANLSAEYGKYIIR